MDPSSTELSAPSTRLSKGVVAADIGASTGGFTDCLLRRGAARVYAIDVGYGQLAWSLRRDSRVVVIERQSIRTLASDAIPEPIDLAVVDVSFISLRVVLPHVIARLRAGGEIVALVKPQFEVGPGRVGKGGVVRDPALREEVLANVAAAGPGSRARGSGGEPSLRFPARRGTSSSSAIGAGLARTSELCTRPTMGIVWRCPHPSSWGWRAVSGRVASGYGFGVMNEESSERLRTILEARGHELEVVFRCQFGDQIGEDVLSALYEAIEVR